MSEQTTSERYAAILNREAGNNQVICDAADHMLWLKGERDELKGKLEEATVGQKRAEEVSQNLTRHLAEAKKQLDTAERERERLVQGINSVADKCVDRGEEDTIADLEALLTPTARTEQVCRCHKSHAMWKTGQPYIERYPYCPNCGNRIEVASEKGDDDE